MHLSIELTNIDLELRVKGLVLEMGFQISKNKIKKLKN